MSVSGKGARNKGQVYERQVRQWFSDFTNWGPIDSNRSGYDGDDLRFKSLTFLSVEIKNHAKMNLAGWVDQARENAKDIPAAVIHKRKGKSAVSEHYVTMSVKDFQRLIDDLK